MNAVSRVSTGCGACTVQVIGKPSDLAAYAEEWQALCEDAEAPNVFFEPWILVPIITRAAQTRRIAIAFVRDGERLVGVFPMERRSRFSGLPVSHLAVFAHDQLFAQTPHVARGRAETAWCGLLGWLERDGSGILDWGYLPADGAVAEGLRKAVRDRGGDTRQLDRYQRAALRRDPEGAEAAVERGASAKSRKRWRRLRRRLEEEGALQVRTLEPSAPAEPWVEAFLTLEAKGWKGIGATALSDQTEGETAFREICAAAHGRRVLHAMSLNLDGTPVAMQVNLFAGEAGFAFKVAYDEEFARFSPGILLELEAVHSFHARPGFQWVDSCTGASRAAVERLWPERIALERVMLTGGRGPGLGKLRALSALRRAARILRRVVSRNDKIGSTPREEGAGRDG